MTRRRCWEDLPAHVRDAVQARTGTVRQVTRVAAGSVSELAVTLFTDTGRLFIKGTKLDAPLAWTYHREATINPWVSPLAPRLRWAIEQGEWLLLAFDYAPGRHANASPGSPDLDALAATLTAISRTPCPPIKVQPATRRWAGRIDEHLVDGTALVHTDMSLKNFLISGHTVRVVDWATPCRGVAWLDTAWMIPRLIAAGHTPDAAEEWARQIPAWSDASPDAVTAFASALAGMWEEWQRERPAPHRGPLAAAARTWATCRAATATRP